MKKYLVLFFLAMLTVILSIIFAGTPTILDGSDVTKISRQYPTIFLIRHGEKCERSQNKCLSATEGITVNGTNKTQQYGKVFNKIFSFYGLYSTYRQQTVQTATFFKVVKNLRFQKCQLVIMTE